MTRPSWNSVSCSGRGYFPVRTARGPDAFRPVIANMHRERHLPLPVHVRLCLRGIECIRADDMTGRRKAASCRLIRPVRYGLLSSGGNRRMQGIEVRAGKFALIKGMNLPPDAPRRLVPMTYCRGCRSSFVMRCHLLDSGLGGPACFAARAARQPVSGALCFGWAVPRSVLCGGISRSFRRRAVSPPQTGNGSAVPLSFH